MGGSDASTTPRGGRKRSGPRDRWFSQRPIPPGELLEYARYHGSRLPPSVEPGIASPRYSGRKAQLTTSPCEDRPLPGQEPLSGGPARDRVPGRWIPIPATARASCIRTGRRRGPVDAGTPAYTVRGLRRVQGLQYLRGRPVPCLNRPVDGCRFPGRVGCLSCEEQAAIDGSGQGCSIRYARPWRKE